MIIREESALSFDDVLLAPKFFGGRSRKEVDLSTTVAGLKLKLPIISANMPSVTGENMALAISRAGGLGILDRMGEPKYEELERFKRRYSNDKIGASIGIGDSAIAEAASYIELGVDIICIDVAHGNQFQTRQIYNDFRKKYKTFPLIVGNFAGIPPFPEMLDDYYTAIKMGIGGGSVCTTRIQTGCGMPTFQSLIGMRSWIGNGVGIIADGGIKNSGDIVKSLAAGAKAVMIGSLFAGTSESPGPIIKDDKTGRKFKVYRGNASYGTKIGASMTSEFIEGAETLIPYKGSVVQIVKQLEDGMRSGMTYCGAVTLESLKDNAEFIKISQAGHRESLPHGTL